MPKKHLPYNPRLKALARNLRNNSTKSEIELWQYLKSKKFKGIDFHRQKPIDNFIIDFFSPEIMLAIELDGFTHEHEETYEKDIIKTRKLEEMGIKVMRFTDEEVFQHLDRVLAQIEDYIESYQGNRQ